LCIQRDESIFLMLELAGGHFGVAFPVKKGHMSFCLSVYT
jgi:hypothetical protein